jgi:hypothetical protein
MQPMIEGTKGSNKFAPGNFDLYVTSPESGEVFQKISAIKAFREVVYCSLKEAKEFIDASQSEPAPLVSKSRLKDLEAAIDCLRSAGFPADCALTVVRTGEDPRESTCPECQRLRDMLADERSNHNLTREARDRTENVVSELRETIEGLRETIGGLRDRLDGKNEEIEKLIEDIDGLRCKFEGFREGVAFTITHMRDEDL